MIFSQPGLGCDAGRAPPSQPRPQNPAPATNVTRQKSTYPPRGTVQTTGASSKFVWRETFERLSSSAKIICVYEVVEVTFELLMAIIVVSLDGGFFDGS